MKRIFTLLVFTVVCISIINAQFTTTWQSNANTINNTGTIVSTGPYTWFQGSPAATGTPGPNVMVPPATAQPESNNVASLDYNPVTNKLLVSHRNNNIYIINAETGVQEGTLPLAGGAIGTEAFKWNKIRVTSTGVIYGISLATGAGTARIYRWENQTSNPTLCASFAVTERTGDSFGLSGSGTSTILYASGSAMAATPAPANSVNIYVLNTTDGLNFTLNKTINLPTAAAGQWANRAIDPVTNDLNSDLWINGGGFNVRRITVSGTTGTAAYSVPAGSSDGQISTAFGGLRFLNTGSRRMVAVAGANNSGDGTRMRLIEVTNETTTATVEDNELYPATSFTTNGNATGDVAFRNHGDGSYTIFYLATNNGIKAIRSATTLPVTLTSFNGSINGNVASLNWTTANEVNNKGFEVERSANGTNFSNIGFVAAGNGNYSFTDGGASNANNYYRLKQVDKDGKFTYSNVLLLSNAKSTNDVKLFGNPVANRLVGQLTVKAGGEYTISIVDNSGRVLLSDRNQFVAGVNQFEVNTTALKSGVYYLQMMSASQKTTTRFVVEK